MGPCQPRARLSPFRSTRPGDASLRCGHRHCINYLRVASGTHHCRSRVSEFGPARTETDGARQSSGRRGGWRRRSAVGKLQRSRSPSESTPTGSTHLPPVLMSAAGLREAGNRQLGGGTEAVGDVGRSEGWRQSQETRGGRAREQIPVPSRLRPRSVLREHARERASRGDAHRRAGSCRQRSRTTLPIDFVPDAAPETRPGTRASVHSRRRPENRAAGALPVGGLRGCAEDLLQPAPGARRLPVARHGAPVESDRRGAL